MAARKPAKSQVTDTLFWSDTEGQAGDWVLVTYSGGAAVRTRIKGLFDDQREQAVEKAERELGRKLNEV